MIACLIGEFVVRMQPPTREHTHGEPEAARQDDMLDAVESLELLLDLRLHDYRAATRLTLQPSLAHERAQRRAHRLAAHAKLPRQLDLRRQPRAGWQLTIGHTPQDLIADPPVEGVRRLAHLSAHLLANTPYNRASRVPLSHSATQPLCACPDS